MIASRGEPFPQTIVALGLVDRSDLRLFRFDGSREHALEAVIVNPRKTVEVSSFGRRIAAQSSALVLRKNLKSGLPSCRGLSLSISLAIIRTANLSALSNVTANRRIASCQARSVLAYHSIP
jgi:hypothetical protein